MKSRDYRILISRMAQNILRKRFPGINKKQLELACVELSVNIHARMYGANIDGVDSPIWRERQCGDHALQPPPNQPNVDASELLKEDD